MAFLHLEPSSDWPPTASVMGSQSTDRMSNRNERINSSISIYKWNLAWYPKVPLFIGILSAITLATALQVLVAGTIMGTIVVLFAYFLAVHEVNTQYERVISTFTETEEMYLTDELSEKYNEEVVETFIFSYTNDESPPGVQPSEQYRFNMVVVTEGSISIAIGTDFDLANRKRMMPLSLDTVSYDILARVEANEVPSSGHTRFAAISKQGETFDFETAESAKAQDAAEAVSLAVKGESVDQSISPNPDPSQPV